MLKERMFGLNGGEGMSPHSPKDIADNQVTTEKMSRRCTGTSILHLPTHT